MKPGGAAKVSFLDFHSAIFSLILAEEYRQAALFLTISVPRLMDFARFQDLSVLFLVFRLSLVNHFNKSSKTHISNGNCYALN